MERVERPPQSLLILIASIVHLLATLASSFMRWYGFVIENTEEIDDNQLDLFNHHLTHLITFYSLLWCLLLGTLRMSIRTLSCRTICVTLF